MYIVLFIFLSTALCVCTIYFDCLQRIWDHYYANILEDFKEKTKHIPELEFPHITSAEDG